MRKITLLSVFVLVATMLFAQQTISFDDYSDEPSKNDDQKINTLMDNITIKIDRISGFGGPTMTYSQVNGDFAFFSGGGGGIILNNIFFGGYGEGLSNAINTASPNEVKLKSFEHGGFWLGYELMREKVVHPVFSVRTGWGNVRTINTDNQGINDGVFVVVPTVSAEVNLTEFLKLNVGVEYRKVFNVSAASGLSNNSLSNVGIYTSFVFGWFN